MRLTMVRARSYALLPALFVVLWTVSGAAQDPVRGDRVRTVADSLPGGVGGVTVDRLGTIYVADFGERVYKVTPDGRVSVFATGLYGSSGNAIDSKGRLLQANFSGHYVTRIDRHGDQKMIAEGFSGPVGIAVDPDGNFYVCNCSSNSISRVTSDGQVSEFAASDLLNCPNGITRDQDGNLYVVNFSDTRMVKITPDGIVAEFADLPGGGNGHVTLARGTLYATSFRGQRIYRISLAGEVSLVAGTGAFGSANGLALESTFLWPNGIAAGPQGDRLYVNEFLNRSPPTLEVPPAPLSRVRQITFASFADVLAGALERGGIDAMVATYRAWKTDPATASVFTERQVNQLGYQLMSSGQLAAATELLKLNVESYPQSFNVYDSLGEAYMNSGENELAIQFYEKSLEINPANQNAVDMIAKIRER